MSGGLSRTDRDFVESLIESLKLLKKDCEVEDLSEVHDEVGRVTLDLISTYYEDI